MRGQVLLDFLLPPACAGCGEPLACAGGPPVCRNCRLRLQSIPPPFCARCGFPLGTGSAPACLECREWPRALEWARAAAVLESPATHLVHALKYEGWRSVGDYMGREMVRRLGQGMGPVDCVVPIPTSPSRRRRRGYNQAELIARAVARELEKPVVSALVRPGAARSQTTVGPAERFTNVKGAFHLGDSVHKRLKARRLLVVDDVITTGATLGAATETLVETAPASILAVAFARRVPMTHWGGEPR